MSSQSIDLLSEKLVSLCRNEARAIVVAIDGRSGVGKSTVALNLAARLDATIVSGDEFFVGGVTVRDDEPATLFEGCIDWKAVRAVLRDLIEIGEARYCGFDWEAFDGSRRKDESLLRAKPIIILEGVYSGRDQRLGGPVASSGGLVLLAGHRSQPLRSRHFNRAPDAVTDRLERGTDSNRVEEEA